MGGLVAATGAVHHRTARVISKDQLSSEGGDVESLPHFGPDQTSAGELDDRSSRNSPLIPNRFYLEH